MRVGRWVPGFVLAGFVWILTGGCSSLDGYNRLKAANRILAVEKEELYKDLSDERSVGEVLRTRVRSLEHDVEVKTQLVDNYRRETELLEEMRNLARKQVEELANKDLSAIAIMGPKLPKPLDNALRRFASDYADKVVYDRRAGTVKWNADLLFALGSDVVKDSSMPALRAFTDVIKSRAAEGFEVIVVGHTDNRPVARPATKAKHPTNWHLSSHRAIAVSNILQRFNYSPGRIGVMGCGEYRPVADNGTVEGSSQNRRVEVYLVPRGSIVHVTAAAGQRSAAKALAGVTP